MKSKVVTRIMLTVLLVGVLTLAFNIDGGYVLADGSWNIETVDSAGNVGWHSSLALDGDDNPHISYLDHSNGDLKYAYYDGSWHKETVDSAGAVGYSTSIALDGGDNPHISYLDHSNGDLKYAARASLWILHNCSRKLLRVTVRQNKLRLQSGVSYPSGAWV